MGTTPEYDLPYPEKTDPRNIPLDIKELAEATESIFLSIVPTPTGSIVMWPTATPPSGWLICDGGSIPTEYTELIALIGSTLPDLRGRVPVGHDSAQTEFDAIGEEGGSKTVALASANLPSHMHEITSDGIHQHGTIQTQTGGNVRIRTRPNTQVAGGATDVIIAGGGGDPIETANSGSHSHGGQSGGGVGLSGTAHDNMPPYRVINYIIKT